MHDFHRLEVWIQSRAVDVEVYLATKSLPQSEAYGLTSQMRRAAVSMASNIAEGASRATPRDFRRYLRMAAGSAGELETQLCISADVGLLHPDQARKLANDVTNIRKMLYSLERSRHL